MRVGPSRTLWLACTLFLLAPGAVAAPTSTSGGTIAITAALVDQEMLARPVPLHGLRLISAAGDTLLVRTDVTGKASISAPPGAYTLSSSAPAQFQSRLFRWTVPV